MSRREPGEYIEHIGDYYAQDGGVTRSSGRPEPGQGNPAMPDNAYGITLAWRRLSQDIALAGFATVADRAARYRLLAFAAELPAADQAKLPGAITEALTRCGPYLAADSGEPGSSDQSEQDPDCEHGPGACPPDCDCRCDTCMRRMELGESPGRPEPGLVIGTGIHAQIEAFGLSETGFPGTPGPDPDAMLAEQRQAIQDWEAAQTGHYTERDAAERATSAAAALDDWLSHGGGGLPGAWCNVLRPSVRPELSDAAVLDAAGRLLGRYLPAEKARLAMRMIQEAARLAGQHSGEQDGTRP